MGKKRPKPTILSLSLAFGQADIKLVKQFIFCNNLIIVQFCNNTFMVGATLSTQCVKILLLLI